MPSPSTAEPSIAVVGNCQVVSIASILGCMLPHCRVEGFFVARYPSPAEKKALAVRLKKYDHVFTQPLTNPIHGPLRGEITKRRNNATMFPAIVFSGFHPDFKEDITVGTHGGGNHHSTIIAAAFRNGSSPEAAQEALNGFNFARLGYMKDYAEARKFLLAKARALGFDMSGTLERLERSGEAFMSTPTHPVIGVLIELSKMLAQRVSAPGDAGQHPDKLGNQQRLPIYPFLAKRLQVNGTETFTRLGKTVTLEEYVRGTYKLYEAAPRSFFESERVRRTAEMILR